MKGIIVKYIEDKGFGFLKDENETERFFHLSSINDKKTFLSNIGAYHFTDWLERECFVVNFNPSQNSKGLSAVNIELTDQVFNDLSLPTEFEAKIVDFKYDTASVTRMVSGIKQGMSKPFGATAGSNGTYRSGYPETLRELNIYFRRTDDIGWGTIDVRELTLTLNDRQNITDKLISTLKEQLMGRVVKVVSNETTWTLVDNSILRI